MNDIKVMLVEDHEIVRQGLRALLDAESGMQVIGETGDGLEAVGLVSQLRPDVLLLDLSLPGLHGLEVVRAVRKQAPQTRVVILSMHATEAHVLQALRNGADGYVLKDCNTSVLVQALREVAAGRRYLCPALSVRAVEVYIENAPAAPLDKYEELTTREREVLQLAAEGHSAAQIAARLFISPRTVESHRGHLMHKLGLRTRTDLIFYALQRRLVLNGP
ncbi:MAG TPA: response regulator transcription factor [Candidatus Binatia bacterium]|nr:response regulator transcription factor [Candidatus Binatia bacterium]